MTSPYTVPTGDGYLGVWTAQRWTVFIPTASLPTLNWDANADLVALNTGLDDAVAVADRATVTDDDAIIGPERITDNTNGIVALIGRSTLQTLDSFEPSSDVRAYDREPAGAYLVPADADPFVDEPRPHIEERQS